MIIFVQMGFVDLKKTVAWLVYFSETVIGILKRLLLVKLTGLF